MLAVDVFLHRGGNGCHVNLKHHVEYGVVSLAGYCKLCALGNLSWASVFCRLSVRHEPRSVLC